MTQKEIDREIDKLEARKMMFAERYLGKIMELNEEIQRMRSLAPSVRTEDQKSGKQGKRRSNKC